ncbi:Membrane-bound lytic murein transglycosylase B precursor [Pseudovibrio axinellae]|uniref:Membrane-bound lytic murein transglycosylase B n=1 Tax=Pseudovibrio axinellae TaxID=989403 RepID=A0A161V1S9_9HYPH|nr:lytic murein transglycosylase [Pseudovibrio axinellae]KZL20750.1 Membrane-bound lytic murein transglycosylase B precursor [Pseudovibrio axinellae]SER23801.1 membrane-bound lytic murein transglycosylase B [Pseudovibrio axinellae]
MRFSSLPAVLFSGFLIFCSFAGFAQANDFQSWVASFKRTAVSQGVNAQLYDRVFKGMTPDPRIRKSAQNQPEFTRAIWQYLDSAVSQERVTHGRRMVDEWAGWLDKIEAKYGVNRHVVLAIWGMESSYGRVLDNSSIMRSTPRALATMAYNPGRRRKYARQQLIAALKILQRGDISPAQMQGSWAGAMGHTQFIPTTYQAYAVDITGDGKRDIWNSVPDALASTAAYLSKMGWQSGKAWGYEVSLPKSFNYRLSNQRKQQSLNSWRELGVKRVNGRSFPRGADMARLYTPAGANGPAFLLLKNFYVIKRYNNSDAYALGVGHLSDRLLGLSGFNAEWPRDERPLTFSEKKALQKHLVEMGYQPGSVDGKIGQKTRRAIQAYQKASGLVPDGHDSIKLLNRLQGRT